MRAIFFIFILDSLILPGAALMSADRPGLDSANVKYVYDIFYNENQDTLQSLDVFWNRNSKGSKVLVFVHGGGWLSGDKNEYRELASYLASNGITVVLINYRLSPMVKFPSHIEDVSAAIHWVFTSINNYSGDNQSIYLMGHSAGAHLISLILCDDEYLGKYEMMPENIAGAITLSGVFEIKPQEGGATKKYLGMVFGENESIWERASCKNSIDATTKYKIPPFLICWGTEEEKLIADESLNIINEFKRSGIKFQTFNFNGSDHYAFKNDLTNPSSDFFKQVMQFIEN